MRQHAQSLNEYFLPLALMGVIGILSLSLIGGNLSELFSGMIGQKKKSVVVQNTVANTPPVNPGNGPVSSAGIPFPNLPGQVVQVELGTGKTLRLNFADPVAVAEAAGGKGVTENALAAIQQIITQLREQGEDEAQIVELEKLALAGQKIKALQQQIEAKFPKEGFSDNQARFDFLSNPSNGIVVDGRSMTLLEASTSLSVSFINTENFELYNFNRNNDSRAGNDANFRLNDKDTKNNPGRLADFMRQLYQVEASGLLTNPVLQRLVKEDLSRQIFNSANETFKAPTQVEVGALVRQTRNRSNDICALSNAATCQDRSG